MKEDAGEVVRNGLEACKLLEYPAFKYSLDRVRGRCFREITNSEYEDVESREGNYMLLKALDLLEATLRSYVKEKEALEKSLKNKPVQKLKSLDR